MPTTTRPSDVTQSFDISKADQTISFDALADKTYGDDDFDLLATGGGSGNSVTFTASGKCSVVSGPKAHLTGAGSCSITASQAGNDNYNAAPDVLRSFSIAKASLTVTAQDRSKTFGEADPSFEVSYVGFVGLDNAGSLGGSLVFNFAGKPPTSYGPSTAVPSDAGSYAIRPMGWPVMTTASPTRLAPTRSTRPTRRSALTPWPARRTAMMTLIWLRVVAAPGIRSRCGKW